MDKLVNIIKVRSVVVMPGGTVNLEMQRAASKKAVMRAMQDNSQVFVVCQNNPEIDHPTREDLYDVGVLAKIVQFDKTPKGNLGVVLFALEAAELIDLSIDSESKVEMALINTIDVLDDLSELEKDAYQRNIMSRLELLLNEDNEKEMRLFMHLQNNKNLQALIYEIVNKMNLPYPQKQSVLGLKELRLQAERLGVILSDELEIGRMRESIASKMKTSIAERQKENLYREQIRILKEELGDTEEAEVSEYEQQLDELCASDEVKEHIQKSIDRFASKNVHSSESGVLQDYIENMLAMPWDLTLPENEDLAFAKQVLEEDHYGMEKIKERIVESVAVHMYQQDAPAPILCLVGPPGTGKTSIAKSVARALDRKFERISLGGVRDEAEIRGHRKTYVAAMPGRIATALKRAGSSNPVLLLDELDKMGSDHRGDISSAMLEVLDSAQNHQFRDHYLEMPIDLSRVFFIATANQLDGIPKPLLDRMEMIQVSSYLEQEKLEIATNYLVPKQMHKHGLKKKQISISKNALLKMIRSYTRESGVRELERVIAKICRKAVTELLEQGADCQENVEKQYKIDKIKVTGKNLEQYLGVIKYRDKMLDKKAQIGLVHGLAWTSVGGDTLDVEAITLPGKGKITFTGNMGDVMKESAQLAFLCVRDILSRKNVQKTAFDKTYFESTDIHLHIPEGAVPKDGPSAGITMATAIYSAVTKIPVISNLAMTGELSLLGQVLPIGGLREKIVAAKTRKITKILVPKENEKDVIELSNEVKDGMEFVYVTTFEQVLKEALFIEN